MKFTKKQIDRYSRQIILKKVGVVGQKKLLKSSVLIVGAGGLGSPIAIYLAALGVGKIGIVDKDNVEISNLGRQIIFVTSDINKKKASIKEAFEFVVQVAGFEPAALCSQSRMLLIKPNSILFFS